MATFTVNTLNDVVSAGDGKLSLREAVAQANATTAADTIVFAAALEGKTLVLAQGELGLTSDVTIDGDQNNDASGVTLDGGGASRHFAISGGGTDANLTDLSLVGGGSSDDGGSLNITGGRVEVVDCAFYGKFTSGNGGTIKVTPAGALTITDSSIAASSAGYTGAGISSFGTLVVRGSSLTDNYATVGGAIYARGELTIEDSQIIGNAASSAGGGVFQSGGTLVVQGSSISSNQAFDGKGGGLYLTATTATIVDSTIADNTASNPTYSALGGGILLLNSPSFTLRGSTVTDNQLVSANRSYGGGIGAFGTPSGFGSSGTFDVANSIIAGNRAQGSSGSVADLGVTITASNGHNIFGGYVSGNVTGDRENVAGSTLFATIDPTTGGGVLNGTGIVPLRGNVANPALGGADPLAAGPTDQVGNARPLPAGGVPDIGAAESGFAPSTTASGNNDLLTGTNSANTIDGKAGNDVIKGLGGVDTLKGGDGGDLLDGGDGSDRLDGGAGLDLVRYAGATKVTVDLRGDASTDIDVGVQGTATDTLIGIEGAIGGTGADLFYGNGFRNFFQGNGGKDTFTGGAGNDLYDYNLASDSGPGTATRDVITDFAHLLDNIDLSGIDANLTVTGDQMFRWVGTAALGTTPGEVGYYVSGGTTIIRASNDADSTAELEIQLTGTKTLSAEDFYL